MAQLSLRGMELHVLRAQISRDRLENTIHPNGSRLVMGGDDEIVSHLQLLSLNAST
jgi:hypothetical protein